MYTINLGVYWKYAINLAVYWKYTINLAVYWKLASSPGHTPPRKSSFVGGVWPGDEANWKYTINLGV